MTSELSDLPHHDGSPLHVSTQEPAIGETVQVRLRVPRGFAELRVVRVRSNPDREPSYADARIVLETPAEIWWEADVVVENPVHGYRFLMEDGAANTWWLTSAGLSSIETRDIDDFRLVTFPAPPTWGHEMVMYQVFPDRFARSAAADARKLPEWAEPAAWTDPVIHTGLSTPRQFYGGDLDGVREHLDHLVDLGISLLYLTPVFPARSNHRYDALSFEHVDPLLGGDDALIALVEEAHARGLKVIGDLTTNHSGDAHEWFRAAYENPAAAESAFYLWLDAAQSDYVSWLGHKSLPKFNWNSTELRRRFIEGPGSIVARFLEPPFSFDGWRIDVANMTGRYRDEDLNEAVRTTIRRTMLEVAPDTLLVGESTNDASGGDFVGDSWHGAMTYANFTRPLWNWLSIPGRPAGGGLGMTLGRTTDYTGRDFYAAHREFAAAFPWRTRLHTMNALDTHDTPRFLTSARPGVLPVAVGLSMTLPGIPVVWAGDEFGLTAADGEEARTPIPWDSIDEHRDTIALYRDLIALRNGHPVLTSGGLRWLHVDDDAVVFIRESEAECVLVLAARGAVDVVVAFEGNAEPLFGGLAIIDRSIVTSGPAFAAWALPGVTAPEWAHT